MLTLSVKVWAGTAYQNCLDTVGSDKCKTASKNDVDIYYSVDNGTMTIYGSTGDEERTLLPEQAFFARALPEGATTLKFQGNVDVGERSFHGTYNLRNVDLSGVQSIGDNAFFVTNSLTGHLSLNGVQTIGTGAFYHVFGLTSVDLSGVQSIGLSAFDGATGLTSVNLTGVGSIGQNAFWECTGLKSLDLTDVQSIGHRAFYNTTNLTSIVVSEGLLNADGSIKQQSCNPSPCSGINSTAFEGSNLQTIYCPKGKTCAASFLTGIDTPKIIHYTQDSTGKITLDNGQAFASFSDLLSGKHIPRRIYTIEEAVKASKPTGNRVSIRYK